MAEIEPQQLNLEVCMWFLIDMPRMIFGADDTHPATEEDASSSIPAVCTCFLKDFCSH
jgi:hypothetical protein